MRFKRAWRLQHRIEKFIIKKKKKFLSDVPAQEWKLPVMLLTVSGIIFIMITAMFGVGINRSTGNVEYHMSPGDDWSQPMINKDWEDNHTANAMQQFPGWLYWCMVMGYYFVFGAFIYKWMDYIKWRWKNVPEYMQYHSRLNRRKKKCSMKKLEK